VGLCSAGSCRHNPGSRKCSKRDETHWEVRCLGRLGSRQPEIDAAPFVTFMLGIIEASLEDYQGSVGR
jgi:hypothetical protein